MSRTFESLTSLGRPLDPAYPTNRAVLVLVPLAAAGSAAVDWLLADAGPEEAAGTALAWAGATLGGWALARELAPDDEPAAFVAMAAAALTVAVLPASGLWTLFLALALARLVNRTPGPAPTLLDTAAVASLVAVATWATGGWAPAAAGTAAFGLDAVLRPRGPRRHGWVAVAGVVVTAVLLARTPGIVRPSRLVTGHPGWMLGAAAAGVFALRLSRTRAVRSRTDRNDEPLKPARVRAGMAVALVLVVPSLLGAEPGLQAVALTLAVMGAVGVAGLRPGT